MEAADTVAARTTIDRTQFRGVRELALGVAAHLDAVRVVATGQALAVETEVVDGAEFRIVASQAVGKGVDALSCHALVRGTDVAVTTIQGAALAHSLDAAIVACAGVLVVAAAFIERFVDALAVAAAIVLGTDVAVITTLTCGQTGTLLAGAADRVGRAGETVLGPGVKDAAVLFVAVVSSTRVGIVAFQGDALALERGARINQHAVVLLGAGIAIVAPYPLLLPVHHAGVGPLFGHVVAPGFFTGILGIALMRCSRVALPLCVARVIVGAGISVLARVAGRMDLGDAALTGEGIAGGKEAVVGIGIGTDDDVPGADSAQTRIAGGAR